MVRKYLFVNIFVLSYLFAYRTKVATTKVSRFSSFVFFLSFVKFLLIEYKWYRSTTALFFVLFEYK
jgi:hypothetical protein